MSRPTFNWKVGDTAPKPFKIRKGDGSILDITGYSATFFMRKRNTSVNKINGSSVVITSGTNGECRYEWTGADVDTAGVYDAEIKFIDAGSRPIHTEYFVVNIQSTL